MDANAFAECLMWCPVNDESRTLKMRLIAQGYESGLAGIGPVAAVPEWQLRSDQNLQTVPKTKGRANGNVFLSNFVFELFDDRATSPMRLIARCDQHLQRIPELGKARQFFFHEGQLGGRQRSSRLASTFFLQRQKPLHIIK